MVVQHNIPAMNANRLYGINNSGLSKSLEKLSSGYAINRAGDNAAGLAVSEKMRAQISGLTQASKNAEDGISMIQTFEGALQETDSILQRMRTLAVQSANGTYQNDVDREAIQLEYDQLNDELNQIADTDFNGVVVLNGGEMADGTKAVNGEFKYVANDPRTEAMQWGSKDINTLDSAGYNGKTAASDALWSNLGLSEDVDSVELTFTYNESDDTWSISDSDNTTALANKSGVVIKKGSTTGTGADNNNGGFNVVTTDTANSTVGAGVAAGKEVANVIMDTTKLVNGDTVKVKFTRPETNNSAPENIGIKDGKVDISKPTTSGATLSTNPTITVNGGTGADAANKNYESTNKTAATATQPMTQAAADAFNGLDGAKVEVTYYDSATAGTTVVDGFKLTLADGKSVELKNATAGTAGTSDAETKGSVVSEDGIKYDVVRNGTSLIIKDSAGVELAKITAATTDVTGHSDTTAGNEVLKASFTLSLDTATYSKESEPTVSVVEPNTKNKVSQSDSNNASTATMTYTDNVTLQTGARTKDSVNFTFSYNSKGLGDLKADLDCSARGLGTDKLSLSTQKDANAAIDKIDNAINKVSMVRASFGAMQNRLEHKIANLDTNNENLTAAESRIRDTDMAKEMTNFTKNQILAQASQAMLAQANQLPQGVLQLLG